MLNNLANALKIKLVRSHYNSTTFHTLPSIVYSLYHIKPTHSVGSKCTWHPARYRNFQNVRHTFPQVKVNPLQSCTSYPTHTLFLRLNIIISSGFHKFFFTHSTYKKRKTPHASPSPNPQRAASSQTTLTRGSALPPPNSQSCSPPTPSDQTNKTAACTSQPPLKPPGPNAIRCADSPPHPFPEASPRAQPATCTLQT